VIRAVIFDFDGVIANSEPLHFAAFREVLEQEGLSFSERQYYGSYLGYDDVGVFRALAAERGLQWGAEDVAALVKRKAEALEALERERSMLFPGAAAAIDRLAAAFPLAIASGALKSEILRVLDRADLTRHFQAIVAAEDTPASKPSPAPYLRAMALLSAAVGEPPLSGANCVAIEDSQWGLDSARAAGVRTIGITHTYPATALTADFVITDLDALTLASVRALSPD
jgi:beta-phosphoglucomutase